MKPTLIFLNGGPGFSNYLQSFFQETDKFSQVLFYEQLRGPEVSIDALIDQLDQHVNSSTGPVYIIGHSWGATLGLEYVTRFESKISGLVIMCSGLNFDHWKKDFDLEKERRGLTSASADMIFLAVEERPNWTSFLDGLWDSFSDETFHALYDSYIQKHDLTKKFSQLKLPVLLISGSEDVRFSPRVAKSIPSINPRITHIEVEGGGHFPFLLKRHRQYVIQKIRNFTVA